MNRGSTLFLRTALLGAGLIVLLLGTLLGRGIYREWPLEFPSNAELRYLAVVVVTITIISFFMAIYQAMKLLNYIDKNKVFSKSSIIAIRGVRNAAFVMTVALASGMPLVYLVAEKEDAPGLILFSLVFAGAPFVVGVALAVAQRLLQNVITMKSENDLTV